MDRQSEILRTFGNRIRIRVCGICVEDGKLLLIKHLNIGTKGYLWAPPGGGLSFGESIEECLEREFKEEVGLTIQVEEFMFVYEYLKAPLHAVELFFKVRATGGTLIKGSDPELSLENQVIGDVKFCDSAFLNSLPEAYFHGSIGVAGTVENLVRLKGYYFSNKRNSNI